MFTANAGAAVSQGVELEAQAALFHGLTANVAFEYDDARYTQTAIAVAGPIKSLIVAIKGEQLQVPPWTLSVGARYDFGGDVVDPYIRGDFRAAGGYPIAVPGLGFVSPDATPVPDSMTINLRAGIEYDAYDFNLFVTNLLDWRKGLITFGRNGCLNAGCTSYYGYTAIPSVNAPQPRVIGMQIVYRQ